MGTLAVDQPVTAGLYGDLAVRFNTFREFYNCVRRQVNDHKTTESCL
jgi:hypothetical protein